MNFESLIRQIAKSSEHQSNFVAAKDFKISIFDNNSDLSRLQKIYMSYLYFYHDILIDISMKKVSEKIMDNEFYEDSYMTYKREKKEDKPKKDKDIHLVFKNDKKRNK